MKRTERLLLKLGDLCYDNRILILSFFPHDHVYTNGDGFVYHYNEKTNSLVFRGLYFKNGSRSFYYIDFNNDREFKIRQLIRIFYGYFSTDPMRKIYLLEYRLCSRIRYLQIPKKPFCAKISEILPYGNVKRVQLLIDRGHSNVTLPVTFDFSNLNVESFDLEMIGISFNNSTTFSDFNDQFRRRLRHGSVFVEEEKINIVDLQNFTNRTEFVQLRDFNIVDYETKKREICFQNSPLCKRLGIKSSVSVHYSKEYFYSMTNLFRINLESIVFSDYVARDNYFKNLRKYAPKIRIIAIFELILKNQQGLDFDGGDNIISLLCKDNKFLKVLCVESGNSIHTNLEQLNFVNDCLKCLLFVKYRDDYEYEYKSNVLKRIFGCFKKLEKLSFADCSSQQSELFEILSLCPETVNTLTFLFPRILFTDDILSAILALKNQINRLGLAFHNIDDLVEPLFSTEFPNLKKLAINDITHFSEQLNLRGLQLAYPLNKHILYLFCRNIAKNLKSFRFCFKNTEPFVYFLKYSEHTKNIRIVRTNPLPPRNFPQFPIFRHGIQENSTFSTLKIYLSDYLFFDEFERGSEYFEKQLVSIEDFDKAFGERTSIGNDFYMKKSHDDQMEYNFTKELCLEFQENSIIQQYVGKCLSKIPLGSISERKKELIKSCYVMKNTCGKEFGFMNGLLKMRVTREDETVFLPFRISYSEIGILIEFSEFRLFNANIVEGAVLYNFISPSSLDFLRYQFSQDNYLVEDVEGVVQKSRKLISRKDFIRIVCSLVGINLENGVVFDIYKKKIGISIDMKWVLRESQRIYGLKFEELDGDNVNFVDCLCKNSFFN